MDKEKIVEIGELASALTPISDMAVLMGVPEMELRKELEDVSGPACMAYRKAKALAALGMRRRDIELAAAGSPAAVENVMAYYNRMTDDE